MRVRYQPPGQAQATPDPGTGDYFVNHSAISQAPMGGAEFRCLREYLGLNPEWLAEHFGVQERTIHRWSSYDAAVPADIADRMRIMASQTEDFVSALARTTDHIQTYRNDDHILAAAPSLPEAHRDLAAVFPASWHRAAAARAQQIRPAATISYAPPAPKVYLTAPNQPAARPPAGHYFAPEIIRAGQETGRTPREIQAALCAAYTEVSNFAPANWFSRNPEGLTGPFMRLGGTNDVYREALWFYDELDAQGIDTDTLTPGQMAWQIQKTSSTNEQKYVGHERAAAAIYRHYTPGSMVPND